MLYLSVFVFLLSYFQCQACDITPQKDFDVKKYMGAWEGIAAASSCTMFHKMKKDMARPTILYGLNKDHSIKVSIAFKTPKGCQQMDANYETIASGHYKHKSVHGDNEVIVVGTDYSKFSLEYTKTEHESETCITMKLYGRNKDLPEEVKNRFMAFSKDCGLKPEDTLFFNNNGEKCDPHPV